MFCECGSNKLEGRTGRCASCNALQRRFDRAKVVEQKPINKISKGLAKERQVYARLRQKFLLNKWCAYHGQPCLPTEIHHSKGRVGRDENGVPLLLATQYFVPVCSEGHRYIEEHPKFAKENGFSESRLI